MINVWKNVEGGMVLNSTNDDLTQGVAIAEDFCWLDRGSYGHGTYSGFNWRGN
jgi:hypothetical protein